MGFFSGFAPTHKSQVPISPPSFQIINRSLIAQSPQIAVEEILKESESESETELSETENASDQRKLVIIVTPISNENHIYGVLLRKLANTLRLIPPPLLWIVVEAQRESDSASDSDLKSDLNVAEILRNTGIMYRHLVMRKNFTDWEDELNHQRNLALKHIEQHKLAGIVHFAGISNVYDLDFFNELRSIEVFGTWAMAILSANKNKVRIEGPVCDTSNVIGWHLKKLNNETYDDNKMPPIHISSFGFNSSILWDPERWGRPSSAQGTSQNSIKFVKEVVLEDETKLKGIPQEDCSKIMLWNLQFPFGSSQH